MNGRTDVDFDITKQNVVRCLVQNTTTINDHYEINVVVIQSVST